MDWSSADVIAVVEHNGFTRKRRESHDTYVKPGHPRTVTIPRNANSITPGTLSSIWRQAGKTAAQARQIRQGES